LLSRASRPLTFEITAVNEKGESLPISIAGEHPLTLYVDKREIVTLMTLGAWPEALAIGYLRNQRLVGSLEEIASVQVDWDVNAVAVTTRRGLPDVAERMDKRTVTTGCGQGTMFGDLMQDVENIRLPADVRLDQTRLYALTQEVRQLQTVYKQAGAVHGCALVRNGAEGVEVLMFVEDVGRHNAVDAIAGQMWLDGLEGGDKIFFTTGRLTSEMVIKTAQMGIPFLISRSGLTQMGWEIARQTGITAIGRAQGRHYLVYTGVERFSR
jgi:FdhD protein